MPRLHNQPCDECDMAEFFGMTYDAAHRSSLWALCRAWEDSADTHQQRADTAAQQHDAVNFNRQDAYAYAARLHAQQLRQRLNEMPR